MGFENIKQESDVAQDVRNSISELYKLFRAITPKQYEEQIENIREKILILKDGNDPSSNELISAFNTTLATSSSKKIEIRNDRNIFKQNKRWS